MTPQELERLGVEFVRIKNDKTRDILGSGLGLSILKRVSHLYDGQVQVESEPDQGGDPDRAPRCRSLRPQHPDQACRGHREEERSAEQPQQRNDLATIVIRVLGDCPRHR